MDQRLRTGRAGVAEQGGRRVALTQRLTEPDLGELNGIEATAHQFQRWTPKREEARVIVIGRQLFAVAIRAHSGAARVDWRADYEALTYEQVNPPNAVRRGIRAVTAELGLVYGAFDFVITPKGRWVFLEVNPGGQYGWLEDVADVPLTATLADLLAQGAA